MEVSNRILSDITVHMKYARYIDCVLTSNPVNLTNSDIILDKLFDINSREIQEAKD